MTAQIRPDTIAGELADPKVKLPRIEWLDGVRALAAVYVVLHHVWLMSYGGFPNNGGPWVVGWMVYGHLAVAVFIVVSGFSLTLSPARTGFRLKDGASGFIRRRFWRIVPPFWFALAFAAGLITLGAIGTPSGAALQIRDVVINALLMHDAVGNVSPNGVFWSIAVEWHIYFFLPLLMWSFRRFGPPATAAAATILIMLIEVLGLFVPAIALLGRFTPQFFALFVFGMLAVWLAGKVRSASRWTAAAAFISAGFVVMCVIFGSAAIVGAYFWIDLIVGVGTMCIFVALANGRPGWLRRFLSCRPLAFTGEFAFSLYLVHAPVLDLVRVHIVEAAGWKGDAAFWGMLGIGGPLAFGASYLFFLAFERVFIRIRSWGQMVQLVRPHLARAS